MVFKPVSTICRKYDIHKDDSRDTMIGIIYRPPNQNSEFFTVFPRLLENVWLKFSNIVLLGDFNTNYFRANVETQRTKERRWKGYSFSLI